MSTAVQDKLDKEIVLRASQERVYAALTDPEKIVNWFPDAVEGKLEPGERPVFDFGEYGKHSIFVVAADPYSYFAYRWIPGSVHVPVGFVGDVLQEPHTLVEFHLEPIPEGTKLRLVESGFSSLPADVMEQCFKDNTGGWEYMLDRL